MPEISSPSERIVDHTEQGTGDGAEFDWKAWAEQRERAIANGAQVLISVDVEMPFNNTSTRVRTATVFSQNEVAEAQEFSEVRHKKHLEKIFAFPEGTVDDLGRSLDDRKSVTQESLKDARTAFLSTTAEDGRVREIFEAYNSGHYVGDVQAAEMLRTNNELRVAIGEYFIDKIATMGHQMPARVYDNGMKTPQARGYGGAEMTSREYASLLALSMLDGTFKAARAAHDPILVGESGVVELGQHRYAAHLLLDNLKAAHSKRGK